MIGYELLWVFKVLLYSDSFSTINFYDYDLYFPHEIIRFVPFNIRDIREISFCAHKSSVSFYIHPLIICSPSLVEEKKPLAQLATLDHRNNKQTF